MPDARLQRTRETLPQDYQFPVTLPPDWVAEQLRLVEAIARVGVDEPEDEPGYGVGV